MFSGDKDLCVQHAQLTLESKCNRTAFLLEIFPSSKSNLPAPVGAVTSLQFTGGQQGLRLRIFALIQVGNAASTNLTKAHSFDATASIPGNAASSSLLLLKLECGEGDSKVAFLQPGSEPYHEANTKASLTQHLWCNTIRSPVSRDPTQRTQTESYQIFTAQPVRRVKHLPAFATLVFSEMGNTISLWETKTGVTARWTEALRKVWHDLLSVTAPIWPWIVNYGWKLHMNLETNVKNAALAEVSQ